MLVWVIHILSSRGLIRGLVLLIHILIHMRSLGGRCLGLMVADRLVVADNRLRHILGARGLIIHSFIVGDRVIMPLPDFWQGLGMIIHLVCLMMLLVMVRLMVSDDDVLLLLLSSVPAVEVGAKPAEAGEAALVNLTEEAEVISSHGDVSY